MLRHVVRSIDLDSPRSKQLYTRANAAAENFFRRNNVVRLQDLDGGQCRATSQSRRGVLSQYILPTDAHKLGQAELVCIDEAAAIPLPLVRKLLGPYLVFLSSTVNGWGRPRWRPSPRSRRFSELLSFGCLQKRRPSSDGAALNVKWWARENYFFK